MANRAMFQFVSKRETFTIVHILPFSQIFFSCSRISFTLFRAPSTRGCYMLKAEYVVGTGNAMGE